MATFSEVIVAKLVAISEVNLAGAQHSETVVPGII
jgi:hypothetical protein